MTVHELIQRFPEIPQDLHDEPLLARFAQRFDGFLRTAQNPGACSAAYTPDNQYYLKLVGPIRLYMYGLSTKDKVLSKIQALLDQHEADASGFAESLLASDVRV